MKKIIGTMFATVAGLVSTTTLALAQVPTIEPIQGTTDVGALLNTVIQWLFGITGAIAVIYLIYGGIVYITGGAKGADTGKTLIINAITGIAIIALSYAIVKMVTSILGG